MPGWGHNTCPVARDDESFPVRAEEKIFEDSSEHSLLILNIRP
jgi:hypothetical protein